MVKIAVDAGHGLNTPGKRTPDGEREWSFNNKVALAAIAELNTYQNVQTLRVDDPTGKTDVSLRERTNKANNWKADVYVSCHHNAFRGTWGSHGGVEAYTFNGANANSESPKIAKLVHGEVVKAMGLRDRGLKKANFHVLRETIGYPALLVEGGFMDSTVDIKALRNDAKLKAQGKAIATGLAKYYKLKKIAAPNPKPNGKLYKVQIGAYSKLENAQKKADQAKRAGFDVYIEHAPQNNPTPTKSKKFKVGQKVEIRQSATTYSRTTTLIPARVIGNTYTIQQVGEDDVLLKEIFSWVRKKDLN